jgi:hypothetical protein
MKNRIATAHGASCRRAPPAAACTLALAFAAWSPSGGHCQIDATWTLTAGGQTVQANPDGSFRIGNIASPDLFGPGGPGTAPDFVGDDPVRVLGRGSAGGKTIYVWSEPFRLVQGETVLVPRLTISSEPPPFPERIAINLPVTTLEPGETAQLAVIGTLGVFFDHIATDLTRREQGTTYRTSHPGVARVDELGRLTARSAGVAFITATHEGLTAVRRVTVVSDLVRLTIAGTLRLPGGGPAVGAVVSGPRGQSAVAGEEGSFTLVLRLTAGERPQLRVELMMDGEIFTAVIPIGPLQDGEILDLGTVMLEPKDAKLPVTVLGQALLPDGSAAAGATVTVASRFQGEADASGRFRVEGSVAPRRRFAILARKRIELGTFSARVLGLERPPSGVVDLGTVQLLAGEGLELPSRRFETGTNQGSIALADLDADGVIDIVTPNITSHDVSVLLGTGDGTFRDQVRYSAGIGPSRVALGDLQGDGAMDIVTANFSSRDVSVLLGAGDGTFGGPMSYATGNTPWSVALGDLQGDGALDIVTTTTFGNDLSVLLGAGDGTFGAPGFYTTGSNPRSVKVVDVQADGVLDVVVANAGSNSVSVLIGTGDGRFLGHVSYAAGIAEPVSIALGDLQRDGTLDIVAASTRGFTSVLLGAANGSFLPPVRHEAGNGSGSVALGDLQGDEVLDIVTANSSPGPNGISVLTGTGDGSFLPQVRYPAGLAPVAVALADLQDNGALDIVTASNAPTGLGYVSVLLGRGAKGLSAQTRHDVGTDPRGVAAGDLDADGALDMVVANAVGNDHIAVLRGTGAGGFLPEERYAAGSSPYSVAIGDLQGDGVLDIVAAGRSSHDISVFLGAGDGSFLSQERHAVGLQPESVAMGDLQGDGVIDIVTANFASNDISVLLGGGDGSFHPESRYAVRTRPQDVALGDLQGQGGIGIVTANSGATNVSVLLFALDGRFLSHVTYAAGSTPRSVKLGDLDGDEVLDIVVSNSSTNDVSVLLGTGTGTFLGQVRQEAGRGPGAIALGDLDGDAVLDIAVVNSVYHSLSVLLGAGDASFITYGRYAIGASSLRGVAFGDMQGDGALDIVVTGAGAVTVLLSR